MAARRPPPRGPMVAGDEVVDEAYGPPVGYGPPRVYYGPPGYYPYGPYYRGWGYGYGQCFPATESCPAAAVTWRFPAGCATKCC